MMIVFFHILSVSSSSIHGPVYPYHISKVSYRRLNIKGNFLQVSKVFLFRVYDIIGGGHLVLRGRRLSYHCFPISNRVAFQFPGFILVEQQLYGYVFGFGSNYVPYLSLIIYSLIVFIVMKVLIVSGDFAGGQRNSGVEKGPNCLLDEGQLVKRISMFGEVKVMPSLGLHELTAPTQNLSDTSDNTSAIPKIHQSKLVSEATRKLYQATCEERAISCPDLVITLGGDHSISIGSVLATAQAYPEFCVIWVDAHADINTPSTTPSGNIHGMPLGFLCNIDACIDSTPEFHWMRRHLARKEEPLLSKKSPMTDNGTNTNDGTRVSKGTTSRCLDETRLAYIGLRDVDEGEAEILKRGGPIVFTTHDVTLRGIQDVMKSILDRLPPHLPIHLSFDIDALDPNYAPSTGTPVNGGLHLDDALHITRILGETGRLVALDLVEVNPDIYLGDPKEDRATTIASALAIIQSVVETTSLTKPAVV